MTKSKERQQATMELPIQVLPMQELTDVCARLNKTGFSRQPVSMLWVLAALRAQLNLRETKHPYHPKTTDGMIVGPDPTLFAGVNA